MPQPKMPTAERPRRPKEGMEWPGKEAGEVEGEGFGGGLASSPWPRLLLGPPAEEEGEELLAPMLAVVGVYWGWVWVKRMGKKRNTPVLCALVRRWMLASRLRA